jgi:hypothetical protein
VQVDKATSVAGSAGVAGAGGSTATEAVSGAGAGGSGAASTAGGPSLETAPAGLAVGPFSSCVLQNGGKVACFGRCGPEGSGGSRDRAPAGLKAKAITVGRAFACAVLVEAEAGSTVRCWGAGAAATPPSMTDAIAISAGDSHACAIDASGSVVCWGDAAPTPPPELVAKELAASGAMTCAIAADDSVRCFGPHVAEPPADLKAKHVAVASQLADPVSGPRYGCAITLADAVRCWGDDSGGAQAVPAGLSAHAIALGRGQACAITPSNAVRCWGSAPRYGAVMPEGLEALALSMAFRTAGALKPDGSFAFWGDLSDGRGAPPEEP